jgi:NAD-dependent dihydropyrimidine dehydrogenase PreA subunit
MHSYYFISYKTDNEGFWYPETDEEECTNCGLCEEVCPIINAKELKKACSANRKYRLQTGR